MRWNWLILLLVTTIAQASGAPPATQKISGESLVLAGQTPSKLLGEGVDPSTVVVRSTHPPGKGTVYEAGRDYEIDATAGTVNRTLNSRIPDFATNILFGKKDFDQNQFPGYGNTKF